MTYFSIFLCLISGSNGGARASGSSDEGIGPETGDHDNRKPSIPLRSSNGTPAPATLIMTSRYVSTGDVSQEAFYDGATIKRLYYVLTKLNHK